MKIVIIIGLLVSFAGCDSKIHYYELDVINRICEPRDGIKSVWRDVTTIRAYCKDGTLVSAKD